MGTSTRDRARVRPGWRARARARPGGRCIWRRGPAYIYVNIYRRTSGP